MVDRNLPEHRIFVNEYLAPYFQSFYKKAKRLGIDKEYQFTWVHDGRILVNKDELTKKVLFVKSRKIVN